MLKNKGFSLVEIMIAIGILGGVSLAIMQIAKTSSQLQSNSQAGFDELELFTSIRMILNNTKYCRVSLAGNDPINTPIQFKKTDIDDIVSEGLDVELWLSDVSGSTRSLKKYSATDITISKQGKIQIKKIKLVMDNPTTPSGQNYPVAAVSDIGKLVVEVEKNINGIKRLIVQKFDINMTVDTDASGNSSILSCTRYDPSTNESEYTLFFGGMFGENNTGGYINPLTGAKTCPVGYANAPISGKSNSDYEARFCYRKANDKTLPLPSNYYGFGGMWGESNSGGYVNPYTGAKNCPTGYTSKLTLGQTMVDYAMYFCYLNLGIAKPDANNSKDFGGAYGTNDIVTYSNPASGSFGCPVGFKTAPILGTTNVDWPVYFCYR